MQRAESPGSSLDTYIDRAYREFADLAALAAERQSAAENAANAEVPTLQQMIDLKQKEIERFKLKILEIQQDQEAARQKIASLESRVQVARERSRRVAALRAEEAAGLTRSEASSSNPVDASADQAVFLRTDEQNDSHGLKSLSRLAGSEPAIRFGRQGTRSQSAGSDTDLRRSKRLRTAPQPSAFKHTSNDPDQNCHQLDQDDVSPGHDSGPLEPAARQHSWTVPRQKPFEGIAYPKAGELYLGRWGTSSALEDSVWYAVIVLPIVSLQRVGMAGSINDTKLVEGHIPVCYESRKKSILGWKKGYEDGGSKVTKRKFPVMWFEEGSLSWLSARNLRPFSEYGPDSSRISGYDVALSFAEERDNRMLMASKEVSDENRYSSEWSPATAVTDLEEVATRTERSSHDTQCVATKSCPPTDNLSGEPSGPSLVQLAGEAVALAELSSSDGAATGGREPAGSSGLLATEQAPVLACAQKSLMKEPHAHVPPSTTIPPVRRKRHFSNRTKTGCQTCRQRRKKCDETKPECNNCIRIGYHCSYQPATYTNVSGLPLRPTYAMPQRQDTFPSHSHQMPITTIQWESSGGAAGTSNFGHFQPTALGPTILAEPRRPDLDAFQDNPRGTRVLHPQINTGKVDQASFSVTSSAVHSHIARQSTSHAPDSRMALGNVLS